MVNPIVVISGLVGSLVMYGYLMSLFFPPKNENFEK